MSCFQGRSLFVVSVTRGTCSNAEEEEEKKKRGRCVVTGQKQTQTPDRRRQTDGGCKRSHRPRVVYVMKNVMMTVARMDKKTVSHPRVSRASPWASNKTSPAMGGELPSLTEFAHLQMVDWKYAPPARKLNLELLSSFVSVPPQFRQELASENVPQTGGARRIKHPAQETAV